MAVHYSSSARSFSLKRCAAENVRRLVEHNRADTGLDRADVEPWPVRSVGVVGAGLMGAAIAAVHVRHDLPVVITDADEATLAGAAGKIAAELAAEMPEAEARRRVARLVQVADDAAAVAARDLVIESIVEDAAAKQRLYARLQEHLAEKTILATNTSTIPIARLTGDLPVRERFCGLHFCHPVRERPLVEIVRGAHTGDSTIAAAVAHAKAIEKMPIVVADGPGFLINRLLLPYLGEALELLLEGVSAEAIERTATDFGMPWGPLRAIDEIGLDTTLNGAWVLSAAFPERLVANPLLVAMVKAGRLGCKSAAGFFRYETAAGERAEPSVDETARKLIADWARSPVEHSAEMILDRLLLPMVLEASRILEEGKVRDARDVDLGTLFGLAFPASQGGLLYWADTLGAAEIIRRLGPLAHLGPRVQPTAILAEMARTGGRFY